MKIIALIGERYMRLKSFLKLVEIQTKVASMTPFLLGSIFVFYRYRQFKPLNFVLMLISLLSFDMVTTAINNYIDFKKANRRHGYGYERHNAIVRDNLRESTVLAVIVILIILAVAGGILLYLNTSPIVLIIGAISFSVGILYSFGPVPISRMPLGEIFSGLFMGFVITFLTIFIHITDLELFSTGLAQGFLSININLPELAAIFFLALPATMGIANIMLANNICDIEDDLENRRYTLPIYIGKQKALTLFKSLYYISYIDIIGLIAAGVLPWTAVLVLATFIPVNKNIGVFMALQTKKDTFVVSVKNFLAMNVSLIIALAVSAVIGI